jgi:hypothetical protein
VAEDMHLDSVSLGEVCAEKPDGAGAEDEYTIACVEVRSPDRAKGVTSRFDQRTERGVDVVWETMQRGDRDRDPLGQRPRKPISHTHFKSEFAHVLASAKASPARATAEHRVAHDSLLQP